MNQPQLWNRYSYVVNNPINRVDPDGRVDQNWDAGAARQLFPNDRAVQLAFDQDVAEKTAITTVAVAAGIAFHDVATATAPMWMPLLIRAQPIITAVQNFFSSETGTPSIGGFRAAGSAIGKAEATAAKFGMTGDQLVKTTVATGGKFVDQKHGTTNIHGRTGGQVSSELRWTQRIRWYRSDWSPQPMCATVSKRAGIARIRTE